MTRLLTVAAAFGAGLALMYMFDPDEGGHRRAQLKDKATGLSNDLKDAVGKKSRDFRNRAQGLLHEAKSMLPDKSSASESNAFDTGERVFE